MSAVPATTLDDTVIAATMPDINEVKISGSVMDFPKIILTYDSHKVATFQIINLRVFNAQGRRREQLAKHYVCAWDKVVHLVQDLRPGNKITVHGWLNTYTWIDKITGVRQSRTEIVADTLVVHHLPQ